MIYIIWLGEHHLALLLSLFFFLSHLFIQLIHSIDRCSSKMVTKISLSGAGWKTWLSVSTQTNMPCFNNPYISKSGLDLSLERIGGEKEGLLRGMAKKGGCTQISFKSFFGIWIASCWIPTLLDIQHQISQHYRLEQSSYNHSFLKTTTKDLTAVFSKV